MAPDDLAQILKAPEERLLDPSVRADPQAVGALLDDDFEEIGRSGTRFRRADLLETLRTTPGFDGPRTIRDFAVRPLSDTLALVTYTVPEFVSLRSSIWRRIGSGWRMTFHQGTPLQDRQ